MMYSPIASRAACKESIALANWESLGSGKQDFNLVPDKTEALRIVENGDLQDDAVGDANDAAVVQVLADPVAGFHDGGAEETDVDYVTAGIADLNAVSHRVEF